MKIRRYEYGILGKILIIYFDNRQMRRQTLCANVYVCLLVADIAIICRYFFKYKYYNRSSVCSK